MKLVIAIKTDTLSLNVYSKNKTYEKIQVLELGDLYLEKTFRKIHNQNKDRQFTYYCAERNIFMEIEFIRPNYYVINKARKMNVYKGIYMGQIDKEIPNCESKMFLKTGRDGKEIFMSPMVARKMKELKIKQHHIDLTNINLKDGAYSSFINDKVIDFYCLDNKEIVLVDIEEPNIYNFGLRVIGREK